MDLYDDFRRAVKAGRVGAGGPFQVFLVNGYAFARGHVYADVKGFTVSPALALQTSWESRGEERELLACEPAVWPESELTATGAVICSGELLVGYCAFPSPKTASGLDFRLSFPDGLLELAG